MLKYSVSTVYESLCSRQPVVEWGDLVWKNPQLPKHCLICWLAVNGRLVTKEAMSHWGFSLDISCLFCDNGIESIQHIMIECGFMKDLRDQVYKKLKVCPATAITWELEIKRVAAKWSGNSMQAKKGRLMWRALISTVWYERCLRNAGVKPRSADDLFALLAYDCACIQF
ncbi:hypothetical protein LINPERPRIM_LOCUS37560 [Linum perenne]